MTKNYTLEECANHINAELIGDRSVRVSSVNNLEKAKDNEVSFLSNKKYASHLKNTKAAAICIQKELVEDDDKNYLVVEDASAAFAKLSELLLEDNSPSGFKDIHPTAVIHQSCIIGKNVQIGPYVVLDQGVSVGDGTIINAHVCVGPKSSIGKDCLIHSNVTLREDSHLGDRVILQPGCVIGGCGYGYDTCKKTGKHTKIKHLGKVVLEDDVEIGSNSTIDRGRFDKTIIKSGTKIDNLVMIAHNCVIGQDNLIVAMTGIAGSVTTGRNVIIAAQCGVLGHITIADGVVLAARSVPRNSITEKGVYLGVPAQNIKKEMIELASIKRLPEVLKKFKKAEKLLESFQENSS